MNSKLNSAERAYLEVLKGLPCGVCDAPGPSDAHHIEPGLHLCCIPLCRDCHQGNFNGIHGQKRMWKIKKKTELSVLNATIQAMMGMT